MVQLTRESSQGDGGEYPPEVQQPRPIVPQETPQSATLEYQQPLPPSSHRHHPSHPAPHPPFTGDGTASNAHQMHPPPPPNLKYLDNPQGRDSTKSWNNTMSQQGTTLQHPPTPITSKSTSRDNYNHGKTSRTSIRDAQNSYPRGREHSSSSGRNYGNYPSDKENFNSSNSSRHKSDRSDRDNFAYSDRDDFYARNRGKHREGRHKSGDSYREMERDEDIKPKLPRHFEPIRSFGNENSSQRRSRTESVTSVASVASSRAPPIGGGSSRRGYEYYNDQYGQQGMYDQYSAYYRYYRDHPYYKEYYRQWMQQYGQQYPEGYPEADRSSIPSGRSSVNEDMKKSATSQFVQDFHGRSSFAYEPSSIYAEASMSHLKSYPSGDLSDVGSIPDDPVSAARMTPLLFGRAHIKARFTPSGQMLVVLPKDPRDGEKANVQIRSIQKTLLSNPEMSNVIKKMQEFPGPLTIAETHKEVVLKYCERRIAEASVDFQLSDKASVILMWEYLALLVRQNGRLYGTDIARLLLKGQKDTQADKDDHKENENSAATPSALTNEHHANFINSPDSGLSGVNTTDLDLGSTNATEITSIPIKNEAELIRQFTEYLCLGRKREALDYAIQEGLWGHCLALSAKMDSGTHTRVLLAFLNAIPRHNVLQTLFQQLSGKQPEISKTYSEERWGDWQSHLAMMISNPTGNTEKDQASVLTLGDRLAGRGQLHAAHFCYLLADAEWGTFSNKDSKIVLIGANHHLSFQEFSSIESIQCTEIYEYGKSLEDKSNSLPSFQSYKLIYALRLAEAGLPQEALRYCEVISNVVEKSPTFPVDFLSQVYNLASCLKYNDVHYNMCHGELSEMPDPDWLLALKQQLDAALSKQYTDSLGVHGNTNLSSDYVDHSAATSHPPEVSHHQTSATSDTAAIYSQSNDHVSGNYVSGNYVSGNYEATHYNNNDASNANTESYNNQDHQGSQIPLMKSPNQQPEMESNNIPMMMPTNSYSDNGPPSLLRQQSSESAGVQRDDNSHLHEQQQWSQQPVHSENTDNQESTANTSSPPMMMSTSIAGTSAPVHWQPGPPIGFMPPAPAPSNFSQQNQLPYEQQQSHVPEMQRKHSTEEDEDISAANKSKPSLDDTGSKDEANKSQSGGFLSSLFGWKKSNQAILPDDKDPSITWNEATQKWESPDGSTDAAPPPPPPPKMGGGGAPPVSSLRRGPRKTRYVNTESGPPGQGGAPPPPMPVNFTNMAPIAPILTPEGNGMAPPQQQPPMMMPAPPAAAAASNQLTQDMDMHPSDNTHSQETDNQQQGSAGAGIPMMMAPPSGGSQIAFFNPAQMKSGGAGAPAASGGGSSQQRRLGGNRRVYPTQ